MFGRKEGNERVHDWRRISRIGHLQNHLLGRTIRFSADGDIDGRRSSFAVKPKTAACYVIAVNDRILSVMPKPL